MRYFSMFTGIGGFELGIERATKGEWKCVGYSEIDKYAIKTFESHFSNIKNYGDATKINPRELPDFDMLCGGFPCQAFSIAGKRMGFEDTRGTLFFEIARIVKERKPRILFLENVKGLLSHDKGRTFVTILATLDELGYNAEWQVLNSKYFGVPQNRERVFIIGHLRGECSRQIFPIRENGEEDFSLQTITSRYFASNSNGNYIDYTKERGEKLMLNSATKQGYSEAENGDGIRLEYPESKTARGRVIKGLSNTLKSGSEGFVQHSKIRRLTEIECERLQGFPENWTKEVSASQRYKQIGNAVTVNVIETITRQMGETL